MLVHWSFQSVRDERKCKLFLLIFVLFLHLIRKLLHSFPSLSQHYNSDSEKEDFNSENTHFIMGKKNKEKTLGLHEAISPLLKASLQRTCHLKS